jgi:flagellar biosynthesis/type III secretory pathway M-ring protein FliF/YscJ
MAAKKWAVLDEVGGTLNAELIKGLLEAQGVSVVLSQEGAGHYAYAMSVGSLGQVQILVPEDNLEEARQILADYYAGKFENQDFEDFDEQQGSQ